MLSFLRRSSPELQLYGKLPLAKDYLRIGGADDAGRAFRDWLDHAFSTRIGDGEAPLLPWPLRVLLAAERGDPVVGCLWNSSDAGALRRFPFALFVQRRRRAVRASMREGLTEELGLWRALESIAEEARRFADGEELLNSLRGRPVEPATVAPQAALVSGELWTRVLWPGDEFEGLRATIEEVRDRPQGPAVLPLSRSLGVTPQVDAWLRVLRAIDWLPAGDVPTLLSPQDLALDPAAPLPSGRPCMVVLRRPLEPSDASTVRELPGLEEAAPPTDVERGGPTPEELARASLGKSAR